MLPLFQDGGNVKLGGPQTIKGVKQFLSTGDAVSNLINKGRMDVQNLLSDLPTFAAESLTDSGWTSTGWTGSWSAGFTHSTGNTNALSRAITGIGAAQVYRVIYTCSGRSAGSYTMSLGGVSFGGSHTANTTNTVGVVTTSAGNLIITPTTDFNGTLTVSVQLLTANSAAAFRLLAQDGTSRLEFRASNAAGNVLIGLTTGRQQFTGTSNVGLGVTAFQALTTGASNTAIGAAALAACSIGNSNTGVGAQALTAVTTATFNTAIGSTAGGSFTTGGSNCAIGASALNNNTTGANNTAVGTSALTASGTFSSNTAVGATALLSATGSNNTAIGFRAGGGISGSTTACIAGAQNTFLGQDTGFNSSTQRNFVTCVGYRAQADADNACILGGIGANAVNVGIGGVTAPAGRLEVRGQGTTTALIARFTDSASTVRFDLRDDGAFAFSGGTVATADAGWSDSTTNYSALRNLGFDFSTVTASDANFRLLARFVETMQRAIRARGIILA